MNMEYRYRISQDDLARIYENAQARMDANPEIAEKHKKAKAPPQCTAGGGAFAAYKNSADASSPCTDRSRPISSSVESCFLFSIHVIRKPTKAPISPDI